MLHTLTSRFAVAIAVALPAAATAAPGQWIVHARAVAAVADDSSETITTTGTGVAVDDSAGLDLGVVFMPHPKWGLELDAVWVPLDLTTAGGQFPDLEVGNVDLVSAHLALQYRFATPGKLDPYLGVGAMYGSFSGYTPTTDMENAGVANVRFSSSLRVFTQIGADFHLGKGWVASVDARYAPLTTRADFRLSSGGSLDAITVEVNPLLIAVGIGRTF